MNNLENNLDTPKLNLAAVQEYMEYLRKRHKELESEQHSFKARLALNKELESMKELIEEQNMSNKWSGLDAAFGMGTSQRPRTSLTIDEMANIKPTFDME